jgi:hypothetical protein
MSSFYALVGSAECWGIQILTIRFFKFLGFGDTMFSSTAIWSQPSDPSPECVISGAQTKLTDRFLLFILIFVYTNFLVTEREVFTEKYRTEVFFVQTEPVGRGLYKKTEVRYFFVKTEQARLIKSLYGIYMIWNAY